jgi:phage shock protein A
MGIFGRMADIIKANLNDLLDQAEEPEKMVKQMVIEMEEAIQKAASSLAQAMANERGLAKQRDAAFLKAGEWQRKAEMALKAGNEGLARQALNNKIAADGQVRQFDALLEPSRAATGTLKRQLDELKMKLDEARMKESTLIARSRAADSQKEFARAMGGLSTTSVFAKFDKMEEKILKKEAEAEALAQVGGISLSSSSDPFARLEADSALDAELAALKTKITSGS